MTMHLHAMTLSDSEVGGRGACSDEVGDRESTGRQPLYNV